MEWMEAGLSLQKCIPKDKGLPWSVAGCIFKQATLGLQAAHKQNIVSLGKTRAYYPCYSIKLDNNADTIEAINLKLTNFATQNTMVTAVIPAQFKEWQYASD